VRDLLRPLAYAEGAGLPRRLWPGLAGALAGAAYTDDDIAWLLVNAGSYLVETLDERGRTVYRLYHRAFADLLALGRAAAEDQRAIADCLLEHARAAGYHPAWRWRDADPYVRSHLTAHAAAGGVLDQVVLEPEFVILADPTRLLPVLHTLVDEPARRMGGVYARAVHLLRTRSEGRRAAYLELVAPAVRSAGAGRRARRCGPAQALAGAVGALVAVAPAPHHRHAQRSGPRGRARAGR